MNTTNIFVGAAVVVVSAAVILLIFNGIYHGATESLDEEMCRSQVVSHATGLKYSGQMFASEIECGTDKIEIDGRDSDRAKKEIAEEMRKCWYSFLEGEQNLFNDEYVYCHPCAVFEVTGDNVNGLNDYLARNNMPLGKQTYLEYLTGYTSEGAEEVEELENQIRQTENAEEFLDYGNLEQGQNYGVVFVYAKGEDSMRKIFEYVTRQTEESRTGGTIALGVGAAAGAGAGVSSAIGLFGLASNPIGWAVGIGAGVGVIAYTATDVAFYNFWAEESIPEWTAYTVLTEYNEESLKALNCQYEPIQDV